MDSYCCLDHTSDMFLTGNTMPENILEDEFRSNRLLPVVKLKERLYTYLNSNFKFLRPIFENMDNLNQLDTFLR